MGDGIGEPGANGLFIDILTCPRNEDPFVDNWDPTEVGFAKGLSFEVFTLLGKVLLDEVTGPYLEKGVLVDWFKFEESDVAEASVVIENGLLLEIGTLSKNSDFLDAKIVWGFKANGLLGDGFTGLTND